MIEPPDKNAAMALCDDGRPHAQGLKKPPFWPLFNGKGLIDA